MYGKYNLAERNKEHFYPLNLTPYLLLSSLFFTPPVVPNLLVLCNKNACKLESSPNLTPYIP